MPNFRRYYLPNAIVFVTTVTRDRIPYFGQEDNIELFWDTLRQVQEIHPFNLLAYVLLPDHFHWLMRVGRKDGNFSTVMHSIKRNYTLNFKRAHRITRSFSLWQSRFWAHVIRDEEDLEKHFDYIHWNPVKHEYVERPEAWRNSTFVYWLKRDTISRVGHPKANPLTLRRWNLSRNCCMQRSSMAPKLGTCEHECYDN